MSKFKIINIFDKLFIGTAIFLTAFAWINFYLRNLWVTFIISLILTFSICFIIYFFKNKKMTKIKNKKISEEKVNNNFLAFKLSTYEEKISLLERAFAGLKFKKRQGKILFECDGKISQIILATHLDCLKQNDLINMLDEHALNVDKYIFICAEDLTTNTKIFLDKEIEILNKYKLIELLENANSLPNTERLNKQISKPTFKEIISKLFTQNKAKSYFFCGLILIFSSIILPFHFYYVVFGSMLMLFSIICKLKKQM